MEGAAAAEGRLSAGRLLALALICLVLFLPGLTVLPPFDRDEARFAQASRQMLDSGDYVDIRFQDEARHKKPVGIYWLQSASVALTGGTAAAPEIWRFRLPSLLGALAAVLLTAWGGVRLFGFQTAWRAALMLAGCVVLGVEARMAKTDAVMLALIVAAQMMLARCWLGRNQTAPLGRGELLLFWAALGGAILIKGPIGPMVCGLTALALGLTERRFGWLLRLRPGWGLLVVALIALPWLIAIGVQTHGAFFSEALGHDMLAKVSSGQEGKGLPPGYYLLTAWVTFAPFTPLVLLALPWIWRQRHDDAVRFCLAWIIPSWLVFEAVPTKLFHYTLPTFPALALLAAAALSAPLPGRWLRGLGFGLGLLVALALALGLGALPLIIDGETDRLAYWVPVVVGVLAGLVMAGRLLMRGQTGRALAAALIGFGVLYGVGYQGLLPGVDGLWLSRQAARAVAAVRPCPDSVVASGGYTEPSLVFLLGTSTRLGGGDTAARHLLQNPACGLALVSGAEQMRFFETLGAQPVEALAQLAGVNYSRGKRLELTLYRAAIPAGEGRK